MSTTILLADDHAIVREGLRAILASQPDMKIVAQAATGREAVELAAQVCPDVVVMDIGMPDLNGIEATRRILRADSKTCIVALSTYGERQFVEAMLEAGARAYVVKSEAAESLLQAIRAAVVNTQYLSPQVALMARDKSVSGEGAAQCRLTAREREIVQLLAEGRSAREIAAELFISENTVHVHRHNVMRKLNMHGVAELTRFAVREGITCA